MLRPLSSRSTGAPPILISHARYRFRCGGHVISRAVNAAVAVSPVADDTAPARGGCGDATPLLRPQWLQNHPCASAAQSSASVRGSAWWCPQSTRSVAVSAPVLTVVSLEPGMPLLLPAVSPSVSLLLDAALTSPPTSWSHLRVLAPSWTRYAVSPVRVPRTMSSVAVLARSTIRSSLQANPVDAGQQVGASCSPPARLTTCMPLLRESAAYCDQDCLPVPSQTALWTRRAAGSLPRP